MERQESDDSPVFSILPPNLHRHLEDSSSTMTASSTRWSSFGGSTAQNDQDHGETNDDENDHVGSFRLDESTTTTTTRANHDESLAIVPFASTSTPAFVASSTNNTNTTSTNTNNDSSSSSLERDRQLLLLALLEQVCSLHDATPRTFAAHALNLSERGVLDPAVVRVLFEYRGLAPPASPLSWTTTTTTDDGGDDDAGALVARETSSLRRHLESLVAPRSDGSSSSSSSSSFSVEDLPLVASRWRREFVRLGRLASGSFGAVFRVRRRGLGTRDGDDDGPDYAVKRVTFSAEGFDATAVRTALREVACLSRLDHPHVVRYYASWLEPRWTTSDDESDDDDDEVSDDDDDEQQECHGDDERGRAVRLLLTDAAETRHGKTSGDTKPTIGTTTTTTSKMQRSSLDKRVSSFDDDHDDDDDDGRRLGNSFESDDVSEWTRDDNDDDDDDGNDSSLFRHNEATTTDWNSERTDNGFRFESASRDDAADDALDFDESLSRNHRSDDDDVSRRRRRERAHASPRGRRPATFRYRVCLYVQMQLCRPTTLADWIRDRDRRPDQAPPEVRTRQALAVFRQIVDGLAHVHERSVVHRDLKPANVLRSLVDDGDDAPSFRLGDFGLSKLSFDHDDDDDRGRARHTVGVGTASYASPEQAASSGTYGPRADVFSLGLILLELLSRFRTAHERADGFAEVRRRRRVADPRIPPRWAALVLRATAPRERDRPRASEVRDALDADDDDVRSLRAELAERDALLRRQRDVIEAQDRRLRELLSSSPSREDQHQHHHHDDDDDDSKRPTIAND